MHVISLFSVRNALYRSMESSLILCLGNTWNFLFFLCCWSNIFATSLFAEIQVIVRGGWLHDRKFLLCSTCLKLKSLIHTISLKISFIIIFIYYCVFCVRVNYVGKKFLSCTASGGIKLESQKQSASLLSCCLWSHLHECNGGRKCYCFVMSNTEK